MKQKLAILMVVLAAMLYAAWPTIAQNVACYREQGGAKNVAASGCEFEFQSGSTLDIQAGATAVIPGSILGQSGVVRYPTPGVGINCKQSTVTDTVTYTATVTAISTPQFGACTLESVTGDAAHCGLEVGSTGSVTITVRNAAATPAANAAGAVVNFCVGGTPQ
jgi:hypothetical protein